MGSTIETSIRISVPPLKLSYILISIVLVILFVITLTVIVIKIYKGILKIQNTEVNNTYEAILEHLEMGPTMWFYLKSLFLKILFIHNLIKWVNQYLNLPYIVFSEFELNFS